MVAQDVRVENGQDILKLLICAEGALKKLNPRQSFTDAGVMLDDFLECIDVILCERQNQLDRGPHPRQEGSAVAENFDGLGVVVESGKERHDTAHVAQRLARP